MKIIPTILLTFGIMVSGCLKESHDASDIEGSNNENLKPSFESASLFKRLAVIEGSEVQKDQIFDTISIDYSSPKDFYIHVTSSEFNIREIEPALEATVFDVARDRFFRLVLTKGYMAIDGRHPDPYPEKTDVRLSFGYRIFRPHDDFYSNEPPKWLSDPKSHKPLSGLPLGPGDYTLSFGISPEGYDRKLVKVDFEIHEYPIDIFNWY